MSEMLPALMVSGAIVVAVSLLARWDDLAIPVQDILLSFLWGGVLSGLANAFFIAASKHLVAAELTLFMMLEFALGPVWVWLFIAERPDQATLLGGIIVIGSVAIRAFLELARNRQRRGVHPPL